VVLIGRDQPRAFGLGMRRPSTNVQRNGVPEGGIAGLTRLIGSLSDSADDLRAIVLRDKLCVDFEGSILGCHVGVFKQGNMNLQDFLHGCGQ
jgi:hypothetical protein